VLNLKVIKYENMENYYTDERVLLALEKSSEVNFEIKDMDLKNCSGRC
jgi:hypothetical protein